MPIDYSKFANIDDSDEEAEPASKTVTKQAEAPTTKLAKCANCAKEGAKMLTCSVCKKTAYCSRECQKEDWQFHKRTCKKPEDKTKKDGKSSESNKTSAPKKPKKAAEPAPDDDDDDEPITWYARRQTKARADARPS